MTPSQLKNSINRCPLQRGFVLILFALAWFALLPTAQAVTPAPDGGYANDNTAEGDNALFSNTTGAHNMATGFSALFSNRSGSQNTATGAFALGVNTTGNFNTATGYEALESNNADNNTATGAFALHANTTGNFNTSIGYQALESNNADNNTATGFGALNNNTSGPQNTASGSQALLNNTTGGGNTATGNVALFSNSTAVQNTATGAGALYKNNADNNTGTGVNALFSNTSGTQSTATGVDALESNDSGSYNTATGVSALVHNTSGSSNTADGTNALFNNTTGSSNTACGDLALQNNKSGNNNIALGLKAGMNLTTGSNNIDIGAAGVAGEANTIRIGKSGTQNKTFIAGISGKTVASGVGVIINSNGQLGTVVSSERFKEGIEPMDKASEAILALKPVTFRYKHELDPDGIRQFGLVAEQVEKVNPDLVARDEQGKPYTVRYEAVNAMLLNEFLKEHRKVEAQQATIAELKSNADNQRAINTKQDAVIAQQQKQIEALTAAVRKVSNQLELNSSRPQVVANNQ